MMSDSISYLDSFSLNGEFWIRLEFDLLEVLLASLKSLGSLVWAVGLLDDANMCAIKSSNFPFRLSTAMSL